MPTTEPRTYVVGLPVAVTVHDDGTVTYDVDTSEAGQAVSEADAPDDVVTDEQAEAYVRQADLDRAAIEADHAGR